MANLIASCALGDLQWNGVAKVLLFYACARSVCERTVMDQKQLNLFVIENHDQLYHLWSQQNARNLRVCHIDFHCDLRGMLINHAKHVAYKIPDVRSGVDMGNFLSHAIAEGRIDAIRWIHGTPGGRSCDVNTVKYTEDFTSLPYNLAIRLNRLSPIPLEYSVCEIDAWPGPLPGDFLDIDWDVFAEREVPRAELEQRVEVFFSKKLSVPLSGISVCYSPSHSHDTRQQFEHFVERLKELYLAARINVPEERRRSNVPVHRRLIPPAIYNPLRSVYYACRLWLKRRGIY